MMQKIVVVDFTSQNLGRFFIGTVRREGFNAIQGEYPDVQVQEGGLLIPGFPRNATVVVMTNKLEGLDGVLNVLDLVVPILSPSNKLLLIEYDQFGGDYPDPRNKGAKRPWRQESWLNSHFARMAFNLRHYDVTLLCSIIVEVMEQSWMISGDTSFLGKFSRDEVYVHA